MWENLKSSFGSYRRIQVRTATSRNGDNQNGDRSKTATTKTATRQHGDKPKRRQSWSKRRQGISQNGDNHWSKRRQPLVKTATTIGQLRQILCMSKRQQKFVRPRQQALQCDDCDRWQHRVCKTGLSQRRYRQLVADDSNSYIWRCSVCCGRQVADEEPAGDVVSDCDYGKYNS